ncbi:hypothetical protein C8F01DRAFT_1161435 [Mycena amicta]|nr:hypothetical protein C8F01DRAFT_1161435 [Mycena amicta]
MRPTPPPMAPTLSAEDRAFVRRVSWEVLMQYQAYAYAPKAIADDPQLYHGPGWIEFIDVDALRRYIPSQQLDAPEIAAPRVKLEPTDPLKIPSGGPVVRTRTVEERGRKVLEILSDSESDKEIPADQHEFVAIGVFPIPAIYSRGQTRNPEILFCITLRKCFTHFVWDSMTNRSASFALSASASSMLPRFDTH